MRYNILLLSAVSSMALAPAALAQQAPTQRPAQTTAPAATEVFSTGVAKGRDRLDSATSTSAIRAIDIETSGARSLPEVLRTIPGLRVQANGLDGNNNYTIRGLPLAATGSKFLQFQEDGLPVLEFGDISYQSPDLFVRADFSLAQIESIRGGSASTFASNSPGGIINLISRTGDVAGGSAQVTTGLDYDESRVDFNYGGPINDTLRFHVGGFYREGEGPREIGYDGMVGGQFRANLTKTFSNGYVRLHAKFLDDRTPTYSVVPLRISGSDSDPTYENVPNFDARSDTLLSPSFTQIPTLDRNNNRAIADLREGRHSTVKSIGLESQFDVAGWTITERFRYADISLTDFEHLVATVAPAAALAQSLGGPGARLSYATGPLAGQAITSPSTLNGNGLLTAALIAQIEAEGLDNLTNDIRASRVFDINGGRLTTTAGLYNARQTLDVSQILNSVISDVRGGGETQLVNITTATGIPQTQNGIFSFSAIPISTGFRRSTDVDYTITAPYASINYHKGPIAIGGSLRWDNGSVEGTQRSGELGGGRTSIRPFDVNGDGVISPSESRAGFIPTNPAPVDYSYDYLSYSAGVNWRIAEPFAAFVRYSRGSRASADRILYAGLLDPTGDLIDPDNAFDPVKQAELGLKYRQADMTLNATAFLADTTERNQQINTAANGAPQVERIVRDYRAYGVEVEGSIRRGPFSLSAGGTYTEAEIVEDVFRPALSGNIPRLQPKLIFQVTPKFTTDRYAVGLDIYGITDSFTQDTNQLELPGYTTVNAFVQFRPVERVQVMVTGNNVFDEMGLMSVTQATIPASGLVAGRSILGRTVAMSVKFDF